MNTAAGIRGRLFEHRDFIASQVRQAEVRRALLAQVDYADELLVDGSYLEASAVLEALRRAHEAMGASIWRGT